MIKNWDHPKTGVLGAWKIFSFYDIFVVMEKVSTSVRHDDEYVLTSNGSKDFGEITSEIAVLLGR